MSQRDGDFDSLSVANEAKGWLQGDKLGTSPFVPFCHLKDRPLVTLVTL